MTAWRCRCECWEGEDCGPCGHAGCKLRRLPAASMTRLACALCGQSVSGRFQPHAHPEHRCRAVGRVLPFTLEEVIPKGTIPPDCPQFREPYAQGVSA